MGSRKSKLFRNLQEQKKEQIQLVQDLDRNFSYHDVSHEIHKEEVQTIPQGFKMTTPPHEEIEEPVIASGDKQTDLGYHLEKKVRIFREAIPVKRSKRQVNFHKTGGKLKNLKKIDFRNYCRPELQIEVPEGYSEALRASLPLGLRTLEDGNRKFIFHVGDTNRFSWQLFVEHNNLVIQNLTADNFKAWCMNQGYLNTIPLYDKFMLHCQGMSPRVIKCAKNRFQVEIDISDRFLIPCGGWCRAYSLKQKNQRSLYFAFVHLKNALLNARVPIHALNERNSMVSFEK